MNNALYLPSKTNACAIVSQSSFQDDIKEEIYDTIRQCTERMKMVSEAMIAIQTQGGWESYWNKTENIRDLAKHTENMITVQQRTLDLIVLLMGAAGKMKVDYNIIIDSIEDLSKNNQGNVPVLEYLVKIKRMVCEIKDRDAILESLITGMNGLRDYIETNERSVDEEIKYAKMKINENRSDIEDIKKDGDKTKEALETIQKKTEKDMDVLKTGIEDLKSQIPVIVSDTNERLQKTQDFFNDYVVDTASKMQSMQNTITYNEKRIKTCAFLLSGAILEGLIIVFFLAR